MTILFRCLTKIKASNSFTVFFIGFVVIFLFFSAQKSFGNTIIAKVIKVIDGDSLLVIEKKSRKKIEVRLWGIDAPEWEQRSSKKSKSYLSRKVLNKNCVLKKIGYDRYDRLLAIVYSDNKKPGESINALAVKNGMAWVYTKYCNKKICKEWKRYQRKAKKDRIGLWKEKNPISPWSWKRAKYLNRE